MHNLSFGNYDILNGSISKYHRLESFIDTLCVGSFIESSRQNPDVSVPGTVQLVGRLASSLKNCDVPNGSRGASSAMHYFEMHSSNTQRGKWGTRPNWDNPWNAGAGTQILNP